MKKSILTLVATLTLSNVLLSSISAEEVIETTTTEVTMVAEAPAPIEYKESQLHFLWILDVFTSNELPPALQKEIKNYLNYVTSNDLVDGEENQVLVNQISERLTLAQSAEINSASLKQAVAIYLDITTNYLKENETLPETEIDSIWRSVKILEQTDYVDRKDSAYLEQRLVISKVAYLKLLKENFNEDGSFKDKLYSKDLKLVYAFIKKYDADFLNETEEKYTAILQEIKNRETAQTLLNEIEEKQAKGEAVSDEVLSALEEATANIQSPTIQAQYTQSQTSSTPAPTPQAPAPQLSVTEAPVYVETPQPPVTEAPVYEETTEWSTPGQMEYAGTFATKAEADAYAVANIDWSRHRSYFTSEFPGQGVQLYFITGH